MTLKFASQATAAFGAALLLLTTSVAAHAEPARAENSGIPSRATWAASVPNGPQLSHIVSASDAPRSGFTDLLPYALPAPDQRDAGSCLYMSLTGIAEWWLAKLNPLQSRRSDGPLDLSERWVMNAAGDSRATTGVREWKTDSVYIFNNIREVALNTAYRFTMGWFNVKDGDYVVAKAGERGAKYGESFNWIDQRDLAGPERVKMPTFKRTVLFAEPGTSQWDVGVAPDDLVQKIKWALMRNRAPVQIIYNDFGYWHATVILGFDDEKSTEGCKFVERSREYYKSKAALAKNPQTTIDLEASVQKRGACNANGVFFVRDSIYPDSKQPEYVYDPSDKTRGVGRYSAKLVDIEYSFVTHLANHAIQIMAAQ